MKIAFIVPLLNSCQEIDCFLGHHQKMLVNPLFNFYFIDGGSTDDTVHRVNSHAPKLQIVKNAYDCGIYDAWNKGLDQLADERYVAFVGVDDRLYCDYYSDIATINEIDSPKLIIGTNLITKEGGEYQRLKKLLSANHIVDNPFELNWPHQGSEHDVSLFSENKFDVSFRLAGDLEFYVRIVKSGLLLENDVLYQSSIQCLAEADGISRQVASVKPYEVEFRRIEQLHGVLVYRSLLFKLYQKRALIPILKVIKLLTTYLRWNRI